MIGTDRYKKKLWKLKGRREQLADEAFLTRIKIRRLRKELKETEKAQAIILLVARQTQKELEYQISEITSLGLQTVFDNPYDFITRIKRYGKSRTECHMLFERDGYEVEPEGSAGSGAINVAEATLRCSMWCLNDPPTRNIMLVDEPFARLKGEEANLRALQLLKSISENEDLKLQFIIVGDERIGRELILGAVDKVFDVYLKNDRSVVKEVK